MPDAAQHHDHADDHQADADLLGVEVLGAAAGHHACEFDQEQAEAVDRDAQRHDRDGGAHPGEDRALVGEMLGDVMQFRLLLLQTFDVTVGHAASCCFRARA